MNSKKQINNNKPIEDGIKDTAWDLEYEAKSDMININDVEDEMVNLGSEISDLRSKVSILIEESLKLINPESIDRLNERSVQMLRNSKSKQSLISKDKIRSLTVKSVTKSNSVPDLKVSSSQKSLTNQSKTNSQTTEVTSVHSKNSQYSPLDLPQQQILLKSSAQIESSKLTSKPIKQYSTDYLRSLRYSVHSIKKPIQLNNPAFINIQNIVNSTDLNYVQNYYPYSFDSIQRTWILNCELSGDSLISKARVLLNKLTRENYESTLQNLMNLNIRTEFESNQLVDLMYNKVINDLANYDLYAKLCMIAPQVMDDKTNKMRTVRLGIMLLEKCHQAFECTIQHKKTVQERHQQAIRKCNDEAKKKHLINYLDIEKSFFKLKSLGNIRLIGHLYCVNPLFGIYIDSSIDKLIAKNDQDSLELLCELLLIIGAKYEKNSKIRASKFDQQMDSLKCVISDTDFDMKFKLMIVEIIINFGWIMITKVPISTI